MNRTYKRILLVSIIGLICLWALWPVHSMIGVDGQGKVLMRLPVETGQRMVYASIHSVSMTPLEETIEIGGEGGFAAVKVRYKDQSGAGLPENTYEDAVFYTQGEWLVIDGMDRHYESLSFRINEAYDNRLTIDGSQILLYELFEEGKGELNLRVGRSPRLLLIAAEDTMEEKYE